MQPREKAERGYVDFHKAEFSLFIGGIANDGSKVSSQVVINCQVEKVLQSSWSWSNRTQGCNGFGLDELWDHCPKVFGKEKYLVGSSSNFRVLGKQFGEERRRVHLQNRD